MMGKCKQCDPDVVCGNCDHWRGQRVAAGNGYAYCSGLKMNRDESFYCADWKRKQEPPQTDEPFCIRELNSVPVVAYQPEGHMPKAVGYSWLSKDAAQEIADNLNEIWTEKEESPQESSGAFFYTTPLSSGKYLVVMLEPKQKPRALSPFPVDKSVADDVASALNQLWAKAFGCVSREEKEEQKENERMWSLDGKVIKFGPKRLCGKLFRTTHAGINSLVEFLNEIWDHQGLEW